MNLDEEHWNKLILSLRSLSSHWVKRDGTSDKHWQELDTVIRDLHIHEWKPYKREKYSRFLYRCKCGVGKEGGLVYIPEDEEAASGPLP